MQKMTLRKGVSATILVGALLLSLSILAAPSTRQMNDAICDGSLTAVKSLLARGYNVNTPLKDSGLTALGLASYCYGGRPAIADYLLSQGANVNRHEKPGYSNLMWALRSVKREGDAMHRVAWRMIRQGANLNYQDPATGRTALMIAAGRGDRAMVEYILKSGASKALKTKGDWCVTGTGISCSAADYARLGGHVSLALLLEGKDPEQYESTLYHAVKTEDRDRIRLLIAQGVNVNEQEPLSRRTALHYAVGVDSPDIIHLLLAAGALPSPVDYAGVTPLRDAIVGRKKEAALALIEGGARGDVEQRQGCGGGLTEFGWALNYSQFDIAKLLITRNRLDLKGGWALFREVDGRSAESVEVASMLLERGAKPPEDYIATLEMWSSRYGFKYALQIAQLVQNAAEHIPDQDVVHTDDAVPGEEPEWVFVDRGMQSKLVVKQRSLSPEMEGRIETGRRSVDGLGRIDSGADLPPR